MYRNKRSEQILCFLTLALKSIYNTHRLSTRQQCLLAMVTNVLGIQERNIKWKYRATDKCNCGINQVTANICCTSIQHKEWRKHCSFLWSAECSLDNKMCFVVFTVICCICAFQPDTSNSSKKALSSTLFVWDDQCVAHSFTLKITPTTLVICHL